MKQGFKKAVVTVVAIVSVLAAVIPCNAVKSEIITEFSDVPKNHWGYEKIMDMTKNGLFKGTTEPINGVGTFSPEKVMTRAEFITSALRAVCPEKAQSVKNDSGKWWNGYYLLSLDEGIIKSKELNNGDLDKPMTREEMAMVVVRCAEKRGEKLSQSVAISQVADYLQIADYYKEYVRSCFSYGILCGVDSKGTFAPGKSLTRAEAATVLCRLLDKNKRIEVEFMADDTASKDLYDVPRENGGKKPEEYTWEEFEALDAAGQMLFQKSFGSIEAFEEWMNKAQNTNLTTPWENGGKKPEEYTWEEFEALDATGQMMFQNSFESIEAFEKWMNKAQNTDLVTPWENGGKKPEDYTWEEFEALNAEEQMAFQNSFESIEAFEKWMNKAQNTGLVTPWENGGKNPEEYTWEEFEALSGAEQMAFQNSIDDFDAWFKANCPQE